MKLLQINKSEGKRLPKIKLTIRKQQRYNQNNPRESALFKTVDTTEGYKNITQTSRIGKRGYYE